jgi:hypothetical protein
LIVPEAGDFQNIEAFLNALLGPDATIHFCCWLKIAYGALRNSERRPGQALILVGPPGGGKSRVQHHIITPILAGRCADPKSYIFRATDFNSELIGSEHLMIEEIPSSTRYDERQTLGEKIKEIIANDTARLHKKGVDACTVAPLWRLSMSLNEEPEKLRCLPPMTGDFVEKLIMFQVTDARDFWERFEKESDPRRAFREGIERELPAFVDFLTHMQIPEKLRDRRYGVKSFMPAELSQTLFENEPESHLLLLIDKAGIFDGSRPYWEDDAEDLKHLLCRDESPVCGSAKRLLNSHETACGQYLARLAKQYPKRVEKKRTAIKRLWRIYPPERGEE